jgi:hypothetical protein
VRTCRLERIRTGHECCDGPQESMNAEVNWRRLYPSTASSLLPNTRTGALHRSIARTAMSSRGPLHQQRPRRGFWAGRRMRTSPDLKPPIFFRYYVLIRRRFTKLDVFSLESFCTAASESSRTLDCQNSVPSKCPKTVCPRQPASACFCLGVHATRRPL